METASNLNLFFSSFQWLCARLLYFIISDLKIQCDIKIDPSDKILKYINIYCNREHKYIIINTS